MAKVATAVEEQSVPKTYTKWGVFEKAKLTPVSVTCDVLPQHPADEACKTRMIPTAENMVDHINAGHGGGFSIRVKQTDGKPWQGWEGLAQAGLELHGLRCEVCDQQVFLSVRDITNHLRPHKGKFRGAYQNFKDTFLFVIQTTPPASREDDDEVTE